MLRQGKDYCIVEAKVEYSRLVNPIVEADGKSVVNILGVTVDEADGAAIKNIAEKMIADEIARLHAEFPKVKFEKAFDCPIKNAEGSFWSLKLKKRCKINGQQVPIFTTTSNTDTRTKRGRKEIAAGSTVDIVFQPVVYSYEDWGNVVTVGVALKLEALRIIDEPAPVPCCKRFIKTAAEFGLEVDSSDEEYEIFPGLKL